MEKLKFQIRFATIADEKFNDAYVDSGVTHHFFRTNSSFLFYERINPESVKVASSTSKLIGKCTVRLPIDEGLIFEVYHSPNFPANMISVRLLRKMFKIEFPEDKHNTSYYTIIRRACQTSIIKIQTEDFFPQ